MNKLGKREREVLLLSRYPQKQIAEFQGVTVSTVNKQRMQIMSKLNANSLVEAVLIALRQGIINIEEFFNEKQIDAN